MTQRGEQTVPARLQWSFNWPRKSNLSSTERDSKSKRYEPNEVQNPTVPLRPHAHSNLIQMVQKIQRILIYTVRPGPLQFFLAVTAGQQTDADRLGAAGRE